MLELVFQVLTLRKELGRHHEAVAADPTSSRAKRAFDKCAKKLCEMLNELDRMVADSVVDQVTDIFVETSGPLNHLVQVATGQEQLRRTMPTPPVSPPRAAAPPPSSGPYSAPDYGSPGARSPPARQQVDPRGYKSARQHLFKDHDEEEVDSPSPAAQDTKKMAEVFRRHSRRLSQVAAYAAESSTDKESKFSALQNGRWYSDHRWFEHLFSTRC